jgi:hypothetical protein
MVGVGDRATGDERLYGDTDRQQEHQIWRAYSVIEGGFRSVEGMARLSVGHCSKQDSDVEQVFLGERERREVKE